MAESASTSIPLRIVALGGLGEIGLNLMVLESAGAALIIDAGVMFPEERMLGAGLCIPDLSYLDAARPRILGVVLTHAHEDHIGALPWLLRRFPVPVYATPLTLAFARRRLQEDGFSAEPSIMTPIAPRRPFELGPFTVEPVRVTHSTPDAVALAIGTPAGMILHTGDFKIDDAPVDGELFDRERFAELGQSGVTLLLSDSTNVERAGRSASESSLKPVLRELVAGCSGRFFLSAFSSHIHRIRQVTEVSREFGRRVLPLGRRMAESVRLGIESGQLDFPAGTFIGRDEADFLPPAKLAFLAGGSQGEPLSAMARLSSDAYPRVRIELGDAVVLSSRFIPGNERIINDLVNRLYRQGAEVFYETVAPVHVSGHACQGELAEMIRLTRPQYFVPIHGEYRHLSRHLSLAVQAGVRERNCFLLEDGGSLVIDSAGARRGRPAAAGRVIVDGQEETTLAVLAERRALARDGTVFAVIGISSLTGAIVSGPDLVSRGLTSGNGTSVHMRQARAELLARLSRLDGSAVGRTERIKDETVRVLRNFFGDAIGKRPLVVPFVMEV